MKNIEVMITRPFKIMRGHEESFFPSIIAYGKIPLEYRSEDIGGGYSRAITKRWRIMIYINLWLIHFKIKFDYPTKTQIK